MERERRIAIEILDEFEELLAEKDIKIPSNDRESDSRNEASLYGTEYRNCIRCTYPEQYEDYKYLDEE